MRRVRRMASRAWSASLRVSPQTRHRCAAEEGSRFTAQSARKDERTHLEPCQAAISSAAARPSGPRLIEQISRSRDAPRRFERSLGRASCRRYEVHDGATQRSGRAAIDR